MPPANSQQHTWSRGNLLCRRWCKSFIKDLVVKKALSSYFFCYCIEHFNQAGQITLFNEIHLPGQVYSLGQPPNIQRCPKSCSGEMIFSLIRQQFFFDNLPKHNTVRLLCSYNGIARLSLPLMLAWRQTLLKVLHR